MAIKNYPLNDSQLKNLKPKNTPFQVSDASSGLLLMVYPSGVKSWIFSYTHPITGKRITKKSFGQYPAISLKQARAIRDEFKALLALGIDPYEHKEKQALEREKQGETLESFAYKWIEWKAEKQKLTPETKAKNLRRLELHLFPRFKNCKISEIEISDSIERLKDMQVSNGDQLYRVVGSFIDIMTYACLNNLVKYNPIADLKKAFSYPTETHQPAISPEELPEFLREVEKSDRQYETKLLIKFQLLTMLRPKETTLIEWVEVDWKNRVINLPAEKMKGKKDQKRPHSVALSSQALSILEEMKKLNGHRPYVFSSRINRNEKPVNSQTVNNAIKKLAGGKYKGILVSHGLRSIASTYLHERYPAEYHVIESCLAHVDSNSVKMAYHRGDAIYLERRREIMQHWGDYVEACGK